MNQVKIGSFIAELRKDKNLTQEQLAELLGVSSKSVSRWENGKNMPDISMIEPLCETLGISVSEFFCGESVPPEKIIEQSEINTINTFKDNKKIKNILKRVLIVLVIVSLVTVGSLALAVGFYSKLTDSDDFVAEKPKASYKFDIITENNNDNFNKSIYLRNNKFIFTSYDNDGRFGDCNKLYIYDLGTGKIKPLTDEDMGDADDFNAVGNLLYFTAYTDTQTDWGYTLFEYDFKTEKLRTIFQTPNTINGISVVCVNEKIYYTASVGDDEIGRYKFAKIENGVETVIDYFDFTSEPEVLIDNGEIVFGNHEKAFVYYEAELNYNVGKIKETDPERIPERREYEAETIDNKTVEGRFGDYYILSEEKKIDYEIDNGYPYNKVYYIYDKNTKQANELTTATYWYYYV